MSPESSMPAKLRFYLDCKREQFRRWCYQQILLYRNRDCARYFVLWEDPLVIYAALNHETGRLLPVPPRALLLLALYESAEERSGFEATRRFVRQAAARSPGARIVVLTNTAAEAEALTAGGVEAALINHNAFMDERVFTVQPEVPKRFDAIYDAQLYPYKRHYLASGVPRLALISYMHRPSPDLAYAREIRRGLAQATWLNDPLAHDYRLLSPAEVGAALNAARVGLCLSATEGAMYASAQYLLCGLPVVTTPSRGGRDYFFENDFVLTVDPTPEAVVAGVAEMIRRAPDPADIRRRTIAKMEALRGSFIALVQDHLAAHGASGDFASRFHRSFFHTLLRNGKPPVFT